MHDDRSALLELFSDHFDREVSDAYKQQQIRLLRRYLPETGLSSISRGQITNFFQNAGRTWSLSYLRKVHGAATSFFAWAERKGHLPSNPMRGTPRAIDYHPRGTPRMVPPIFLEYATHLRSLNRTEDTITQRIGDIRRFAGERNPLEATPQVLGNYLREHQLIWSQEYRRKIRASFVSFYGWASSQNHSAVDPTLNLRSIRPGKPPRAPIVEEDLLAAFYSADDEVQAIIALAASMGLRRMEITVLHSRDRNGRNLTIHGKGDRVRVVPLNDLCYELLLELERKQGRGYYFRNRRTNMHLHPSTVYKHAKSYIGHWCLHSLRHRTATVGLRRGANLRELQELLGHLSLTTTQIYAAVTFEELAQVTSTTSWPRTKDETVLRGTQITIDLNNLSENDVVLIAGALSRHLQSDARAA